MPSTCRIVIVGAGHAGGAAAALLRQHGHEGEIVLIGNEPIAPYQRPPLSKAYLTGKADAEALKLRPDEFYQDQGIDLRLAITVTAIERAQRRVVLGGGETVAYDVLILATGSTNRRIGIPGAAPGDLLELRSTADAERLKAVLGPGRRLLIIGGGYIGLEVAASARVLGGEATIVELAPRLLARVASEPLSRFYRDYHAARGVEIFTDAQVVEVRKDAGGRIASGVLADGREIACDAVLVAIGAGACSELAQAAGLACEGGVVVDDASRTSDPAIFAIGDMSVRAPPPHRGRRQRLESVPNALEQARQAVFAILGKDAPAQETPWFWSDQFDLKLQIAGVPSGADGLVVRGDQTAARFAIFHLSGDRLLSVEAVNAPAEFMVGRQLIASRRAVDRARLGDPTLSMKQMLISEAGT